MFDREKNETQSQRIKVTITSNRLDKSNKNNHLFIKELESKLKQQEEWKQILKEENEQLTSKLKILKGKL